MNIVFPLDQDIHFFGEWVFYENEDERLEAIQYLALWVKFIQKKLCDMELIDTQLVDHPKELLESDKGILGTKIMMRGKKTDWVLSIREMPIPI